MDEDLKNLVISIVSNPKIKSGYTFDTHYVIEILNSNKENANLYLSNNDSNLIEKLNSDISKIVRDSELVVLLNDNHWSKNILGNYSLNKLWKRK